MFFLVKMRCGCVLHSRKMATFVAKKRRQDYALICVTADDTYHNLTVTAPSSSDYAYERTLTSVSFYPTETYYIMNYRAMCDQQMTATNTVQPRWFLALSCGVDTMTGA